MDHCAWWKGLRRHLDEMRGCRVGTNYRIWLGKQCYKLNCHSSKKSRKFFRSGQVAALKIILSGENIFKGCCNTEVMMVVYHSWLSCLFPQPNQNHHNLGTIHLRHRQIFTIFDPYPPPVGSFLLLFVGKFGQFLTPPP